MFDTNFTGDRVRDSKRVMRLLQISGLVHHRGVDRSFDGLGLLEAAYREGSVSFSLTSELLDELRQRCGVAY